MERKMSDQITATMERTAIPPLCSTDLLGDTAILQRRMPLCMVGTYREWHDCNASDIDARIKTERDMVLWSESETNDRVKYRVIRRKETVIWSPNAELSHGAKTKMYEH